MSLKPQAILVDADSALIDTSALASRLPAKTAAAQDRFYTDAVLCPAVPKTPALVRLERQTGLAVILVSLRRERHRRHTHAWMVLNDVPFDEMLLRPDDDITPPAALMEVWLEQLKQQYVIVHAYDSHPATVGILEHHGIAVTRAGAAIEPEYRAA